MELEKKETSGREKDEESIKLLRKLREQLYSSDASNRRRAAYKLSWMQEDGLEILKETLFGSCPVPSRNAAAYGLRKMRGRMKKAALEILEQGLKHRDNSTRGICRNALQMLGKKVPKMAAPKKPPVSHLAIRELPSKNRPGRRVVNRRTRR
jgi:HEAT repeat protein